MERELKWESTVNGALAALSETLISTELSLEDISRLVLEEAGRLTGSEHGFAGVIDRARGELIFQTKFVMSGSDCEVTGQNHDMVNPMVAGDENPTLWGYALITGKGFYTNSPGSHPASKGTPGGHLPVNRFLAAPARVGDELLGQIALTGGTRDFTDRDLEAVKRCATLYALALRRYYAEEASRKSAEHYRMLVEKMTDGLYVMNNNTEITYVNDSLCDMLGYTPMEVLNRKVTELFNAENLALYEQQMIRHQQMESLIYELEITAKDGRQIPVTISPQDLFDDNGEFIESFAVVRDISERKRAEDELKRSYTIVNAVVEGTTDIVFIKDRDLNYLLMNSAGLSLHGISEEDIIGKSDSVFFPPDIVAKLHEADREVIETGASMTLNVVIPMGEQERHYQASLSPYRDHDGEIIGVSGVVRDITPLIEAEQMMRIGTHELDQRVKELNCLYSISKLADSPEKSLDDILQGTVDAIPSAWAHPEIACARIVVEDQEYTSSGFELSDWKLAAPIRIQGQQIGSVEVCYLREKSFVKEERSLIGAIAKSISTTIARLRAERELQETLDHLETKVAERTVGLTAINFQLKKYQKQLQSLTSELSMAEERERRSIATEIHDLIAQPLAFAKIKIESFMAASCSSVMQNEYAELLEHIDQALKDARNLIYEISPPTLYEFGIGIALKSLCESFQGSHELMIAYRDTTGEDSIDDDIAIFLYKAARELLTNIIKHADAEHAEVGLGTGEGLITLSVKDDGRGCDDMKSKVRFAAEGGFGLFSIRERLRVLKGQMIIRSEREKGTEITLILPLNLEP